jgi:hypothetical protein
VDFFVGDVGEGLSVEVLEVFIRKLIQRGV